MFTTGSKFFIGATATTVVAAVLFGVTKGGAVGWTATVGLIFAALAFALLAGLNYVNRDCNVSGVQQGGGAGSAADQPPVESSVWPAATALGGALLVIGADTYPVVFKIGVIVLLAAGFEWLVQAWSERASNDPAYNRSLRQRLLQPIEFPVGAAVFAALFVYSFSRVMLWISKDSGPVVFVGVGAIVLAAGALLAVYPRVNKGIVAAAGGLGMLALVGTGAVMALDGQRTIEPYPVISDEEYAAEICESPGEIEVVDEHTEHLAEIDEKAGKNVAITSNIAVTVTLAADGSLVAVPNGRPATTEITVARSTPTNVRFVNESDEPRRFTVELGQFPAEPQDDTLDGIEYEAVTLVCTPLVEEGGEAMLTLKFPKPSDYSNAPYRIIVPGEESTEIDVVVP
jgi:hypothetical protein